MQESSEVGQAVTIGKNESRFRERFDEAVLMAGFYRRPSV